MSEMSFARVVDGVVAERVEAETQPLGDGWMHCASDVEAGWLFDGQDFYAPPPPPEVPGLYGQVIDGVVINRVIATPSVAAGAGWEVIGDEVQIGWVRDGDGFVAPPPPVPVPMQNLKKMTFLALLVSVLGETRAIAILSNGPLLLVFAGAEKIDYVDVFVGIDGDPAQPSYTAQLLSAEAVTEAEVAALLAVWPVI